MAEAGAERMLVCRVGGERFALPVALVRAVLVAPPAARIPGAPEAVCGVANVQGTLVTVVSAPRLLGLPKLSGSEWLVVLTMRRGRVGIEVDEVEDVGGGQGLRRLDVEALISPLLSVAT